MSSTILWLVVSCFVAELVNCQSDIVVKTKYGMVRGEEIKSYVGGPNIIAFRGIPFAKPPVGNLRFRAPQEPNRWSGVLNATKDGSICPQLNYSNAYHGDEDCLYLNVYIPATANISNCKLSVIVFIYGGSFDSGSNLRYEYGPDYLVKKGQVVVIPNYRLGALGFACAPGIECNCGLKDQNMALKWVKENICKFGGNPHNVTLIGQSAGAGSVHLQMLSPMSKGLFHRVMVQSGVSLCVWSYHSPEMAESRAQKLAEKIAGHSVSRSKIADVLYSATAKELIMGTNNISTHSPYFKPSREVTGKDNEIFLPDCPLNIMTSRKFEQRPMVMGFTQDEAISFLGAIDEVEEYLNAVTQKLPHLLQRQINSFNKTVTEDLPRIATNVLFVSCVDLAQRMHSEIHNESIHYYLYDYAGPRNVHRDVYGVQRNGVGHGDDLGEEFYMKSLHPFPENESLSSEMNQVADLFTCLIANFADTGNPTPPDRKCSEVEWPDSRENGTMMKISTTLSVVPRQVSKRARGDEMLLYEYMKHFSGCS